MQAISGFPGVDLGDNGLDHADNELLSAYNPEMNRVISAFKDWHGKLSPDAAYLFLVPKADGGLQGYMPFNRQFGFVVVPVDGAGNVDAATLARTAAHELGHGIFSLRHTFSTKNFVPLPQGTTDNLMDYSGSTATQLNKYQRDLIHDPNRVLFAWAEEEEEGALVDDKIIENILTGIRNTVNSNGNELKISDYYTTTYSYGVEVSKWKVVDFGEGNKFTVALYLHKVIDEANKNIITLLNKTEEIKKRNYLSVNGNCLTLYFKYKERENIYGLEIAVPETEAEKFKEYLFPTFIEKFKTSSEQAIKDAINAVGNNSNPACNICTRAAFYYVIGDPVLFPKKGSCLDELATCNSANPNFKKGLINNEGSATDIVSDLADCKTNELKNYFTEEVKLETETYEEFWKRLQAKTDQGTIIIGTYKTNHVFMVVAGGIYEVVNNIEHTDGRYLDEKYKQKPILEQSDKYGFSFATRGITKVPRILECGVTVKSSNAPLYANMDYNGALLIKWYKYIKK